ncbi:MAG: N-acetylmuramoyl-L-alanine amidase [Pseudomonadota bacterium]
MIRSVVAALCVSLGCLAHAEQGSANPGAITADDIVLRQTAGTLHLAVSLDRAVPWRAFTLADPPRAVVDLKGIGWADGVHGMDAAGKRVRAGAFLPGWSRMVIALDAPLGVTSAELRTGEAGAARLDIRFRKMSAEAFLAASGAPDAAGWDGAGGLGQSALPDQRAPGVFRVVLDPGHGGIDPGAERDGLIEKELMLGMALALSDALQARGVDVVLTRRGDYFVALQTRVAVAQRATADLFVSLHADSLSAGNAHGATIYTLSDTATDAASAALAERHSRSDILAGIDLSGTGDEVAGVLLDLARQRTAPLSEGFAQVLHRTLADHALTLNTRPLRKAGFSVLKSADIPSVLLEVGFLSSARDRANLADPAWRSDMISAVATAITDWRDTQADAPATLRH